mgnify:CR=1 FL=1
MQPDATSKEITIKLPHMTLRGLEWGNPEGKPVLGLHGWLDNAASFDGLGPYLSEFRFVALDWSGHGRSDHRPYGAMYHFIEWAPELFDAADALGWETFSIVGHSMGAGAATLAASAVPERIERMVLIDGMGPLTTEPSDAPELLGRAIQERKKHLSRTPKAYVDLEAAIAQRMKSFPLSEESARRIVKRGTKQTDEGLVFTFAPMLRGTSLVRLTEPQVLSYLSQITSPTLLIRATQSFLVGNDFVEKRIQQSSAIQSITVEGSHHVHLDQPEVLGDKVLAFLRGESL